MPRILKTACYYLIVVYEFHLQALDVDQIATQLEKILSAEHIENDVSTPINCDALVMEIWQSTH